MALEGTEQTGGTSGEGTGTTAGGNSGAGTAAVTSTGATEPNPDGTGEGQPSVPPAGGTLPAYTPNYKFKANKEEKEFPEWARPFVKDANLEKSFRELFEKSEGLPHVTDHRDRLLQQNQYYNEQVVPFVQEVNQALAFRDSGDLHSFFKATNIKEADVLRYALQRIQLREQGTIQQHDEAAQLRYENAQLQNRIAASGGANDPAVIRRQMELDFYLQRPDVAPAVTELDARTGRPGTFKAQVIRLAQQYAEAKQDISVEQAVSEVLKFAGWAPKPAVSTPAAETQLGAEEPGQAERKESLPNLGKGKGTSPVKKQFRSTKELREYAATLRG